MSDLGLLRWFLGIEIPQTKYRIFISQKKTAENIFDKFKLLGCKFVPTPWLQMKSWRKKMVLKKQTLEYIEVWLVVYCI